MKLSPKELDVLALVALGYSDKEIGTKMKISYGTVRSHVDKIVLKLGARNRANAVFIYIQNNPNGIKPE
jgi:DNA-binding NarL/FixJ family response regulator